jgi:hypothetical protein
LHFQLNFLFSQDVGLKKQKNAKSKNIITVIQGIVLHQLKFLENFFDGISKNSSTLVSNFFFCLLRLNFVLLLFLQDSKPDSKLKIQRISNPNMMIIPKNKNNQI